jgi:NitT/TauT family transport system substrate-binding protein
MKMLTVIMCLMFTMGAIAADTKKTYKLAWSHYTSWELFNFEEIVKKHADKNGVKIEVVRINDYIESMNLLVAGNSKGSGNGGIDLVTATNMDGLTLLAVSAPVKNPVEVIVINSYSNGNDKIVSKVAKDVKGLKGKTVQLVELSVSHYVLARALSMSGMKESDLGGVVNVSDSDIQSAFSAQPSSTVSLWNPMAQNVSKEKNATVVFDSSKIPGEVQDLTYARSDVPDAVKQAVASAWQELVAGIKPGAATRKAMVERMAKESGSTVENFEAQIKTTALFFNPQDAVDALKNNKLKETMKYIRDFSYEKGLLGKDAKDSVGVQFPDGTVLGNAKNVKMKFTTKYMEAAIQGK